MANTIHGVGIAQECATHTSSIMKSTPEIEAFIKNFVKDLEEKNVAIFAGAGMSKSAGYVDWPELLRDIAKEVGLSVDKEHDLISLAQYHVNEKANKAGIIRKVLEEFSEQAEPTANHEILARLPITTFWTTNYDTLIEDALKKANRICDIKHNVKQLNMTWPRRDALVYKMHGDVRHPADAILTKQQFESYYKDHEHFVTALSGDLVSKTFLFVGYSFTDPNLDYVLSRLNVQFGDTGRQHYCFVKRHHQSKTEDDETFKYNNRKQELRVNELKRYKIQALLVDEYDDITEILREIERRYKKKTIFISGSAEEYGDWKPEDAHGFMHLLSKQIVQGNYRVVTGFGWGVGSAVINGALEAVYERPERYSEDQLIMKPFPQFKSGDKELPQLWDEYRHRMISLSGISIFIFGNKKEDGKIISAGGVKKEFKIALSHGTIPIPVASTGYMAAEIYTEIMQAPEKYYKGIEWIIPLIDELNDGKLTFQEIIKKIIIIIQTINK